MLHARQMVALSLLVALALAACTLPGLAPVMQNGTTLPAVTPGEGSPRETSSMPAYPEDLPDAAEMSAPDISAAPVLPLPTIMPMSPVHCPDPVSMASSTSPAQTIHLPILLYHHVQDLPAKASAALKRLTVSPSAFEEQVAYLASHNYHTVGFSDLASYFDYGRSLPANPIILTFDDGWLEDYTVVYPLLRQYCLAGTFFPPTNWVSRSRLTLTWPQVEEMAKGGMEFGSHTVNHRLLPNQARAYVLQELLLSKSALEAHTGRPVVALAYPGGAYNAQTMQMAAIAGYTAAVGVAPLLDQPKAGLYALHRVAIPYDMTLPQFGAMLAGTAVPVGPAPHQTKLATPAGKR